MLNHPQRVISMYGESLLYPLNNTKVQQHLVDLYSKHSIMTFAFEWFPVHIIFHEINGRPTQESQEALDELKVLTRQYRGLEHWTGTGWSGETFALRGIVSRGQLAYISSIPGVKFVFKILEADMERLNTAHWEFR